MKKKIKLNLPPPQTLTVDEIKTTIANILFKQMGINPALNWCKFCPRLKVNNSPPRKW
jgi:hypothetical protein